MYIVYIVQIKKDKKAVTCFLQEVYFQGLNSYLSSPTSDEVCEKKRWWGGGGGASLECCQHPGHWQPTWRTFLVPVKATIALVFEFNCSPL